MAAETTASSSTAVTTTVTNAPYPTTMTTTTTTSIATRTTTTTQASVVTPRDQPELPVSSCERVPMSPANRAKIIDQWSEAIMRVGMDSLSTNGTIPSLHTHRARRLLCMLCTSSAFLITDMLRRNVTQAVIKAELSLLCTASPFYGPVCGEVLEHSFDFVVDQLRNARIDGICSTLGLCSKRTSMPGLLPGAEEDEDVADSVNDIGTTIVSLRFYQDEDPDKATCLAVVSCVNAWMSEEEEWDEIVAREYPTSYDRCRSIHPIAEAAPDDNDHYHERDDKLIQMGPFIVGAVGYLKPLRELRRRGEVHPPNMTLNAAKATILAAVNAAKTGGLYLYSTDGTVVEFVWNKTTRGAQSGIVHWPSDQGLYLTGLGREFLSSLQNSLDFRWDIPVLTREEAISKTLSSLPFIRSLQSPFELTGKRGSGHITCDGTTSKIDIQ